jgi:hypothetical protein
MTPPTTLLTESLRLTAFLAPNAPLGEPTWWSDLTGNQPETKTSKPALNELQAVGTFQDQTLLLSVQLGRVDWLLTPKASQAFEDPHQILSIGQFPGALDLFEPLMLRWLAMPVPTIRLAFGAILLEPVETAVAGYRRLAELLPSVRIDPEGSQDFFYQINRPRLSSVVKGLRLNRLSKWNVVSFQRFQLGVSLPAPQLIQSTSGGKLTACRIEVDVSTPGESADELAQKNRGEVFRELVKVGSEIAIRGDIA